MDMLSLWDGLSGNLLSFLFKIIIIIIIIIIHCYFMGMTHISEKKIRCCLQVMKAPHSVLGHTYYQ